MKKRKICSTLTKSENITNIIVKCNSGNKLIFILTFRKLFTNLTQKVMSTLKTEMKSKYGGTPVSKTRIKNVFCG